MDLDLDGILRVTATEKRTGLAKQITIEGATTAMSESDMAQARLRMQELFGIEDEEVDFDEDDDDEVIDVEVNDISPDTSAADRDRRVQISEARALLERSRRLLDRMTPRIAKRPLPSMNRSKTRSRQPSTGSRCMPP